MKKLSKLKPAVTASFPLLRMEVEKPIVNMGFKCGILFLPGISVYAVSDLVLNTIKKSLRLKPFFLISYPTSSLHFDTQAKKKKLTLFNEFISKAEHEVSQHSMSVKTCINMMIGL